MSDLIKRLRLWAGRDTIMSEYGPDEHIAGVGADRLEKQAQRISELEAFKKAVVGWREYDHPEGFCRFTAEWIAENAQRVEEARDE